MAEYIDRNLIEWYGCNFEEPSCKNRECLGCSHAKCSHAQVMQIPPANVVERSEYIELLKENERLRKDLEDKSEALNSICQIHQEYVSKIDKAIEDIEDLKPNNPSFKGYYEQRVALNKALEILKRNIGGE